ncbi:hypothetical protein OROMI_008691 [Orobanche minor]
MLLRLVHDGAANPTSSRSHSLNACFNLSKPQIETLAPKKPSLSISIYTGRRGATCGLNSTKLLGCVTVPLADLADLAFSIRFVLLLILPPIFDIILLPVTFFRWTVLENLKDQLEFFHGTTLSGRFEQWLPKITDLPFSLYSTFVVEARHGFNNDFAYNLLRGTIPEEWDSTRLQFISVLVNRLSGEIPKGLGNISSLTYLNLEDSDIILQPTRGSLPLSFSNLTNLNDLQLIKFSVKRNACKWTGWPYPLKHISSGYVAGLVRATINVQVRDA